MSSAAPSSAVAAGTTRRNWLSICSPGSTAMTCAPVSHECASQLAGTGAEIEHCATRGQSELVRDPRDGVGRILRPRALVEVGHLFERPRVWVLQLRHDSTDRDR